MRIAVTPVRFTPDADAVHVPEVAPDPTFAPVTSTFPDWSTSLIRCVVPKIAPVYGTDADKLAFVLLPCTTNP